VRCATKRFRWAVQLALLTVPCLKAQNQAGNARNVTEIKLERYGWQRLPPPRRYESWPVEADLLRVDSKGRIVIGYPAHEDTELATRGNPRLLFHILRFSRDGKLDMSVSLPTDNLPDNEVFVDAQDHIFVVANGVLQMLTGDDQIPTQQRTWKSLTSCTWDPQYCRVSQSSTRRKLFVTRCLGVAQRKVCEDPVTTVYDTSSSEPEVARTCAGRGGSTTDNFAYLSGSYGTEHFTRRYRLCESDAPQELPVEDSVSAVLNDDLFVVDHSNKKKRWEVGVVTANGDAKFRGQLQKNDMPSLAIVYVKGDASGDRFAIVIDTLRGGNAALDIGGHLVARRVVVYSSESGTELMHLSVYPPVPHYGVLLGIVPGFTFDLSPDGHTLAILSEGVLTIAKVE
jgi:hypothetical protein